MDGTNLPLSSLKKPLELGVMLPHKVKRGKKEEIIKPPGVRIVKKEPVFLKELETIMKSCFLPSEEGKVQKQIMTRLPYAYLDAVNVAERTPSTVRHGRRSTRSSTTTQRNKATRRSD